MLFKAFLKWKAKGTDPFLVVSRVTNFANPFQITLILNGFIEIGFNFLYEIKKLTCIANSKTYLLGNFF